MIGSEYTKQLIEVIKIFNVKKRISALRSSGRPQIKKGKPKNQQDDVFESWLASSSKKRHVLCDIFVLFMIH